MGVRWTKEEDAVLILNAINSVSHGGSLYYSFNKTSKEINRKKKSCESRWIKIKNQYFHLIDVANKKNIKKIYFTKSDIKPWTEEEDQIIIDCIKDVAVNRGIIGNALRTASNKLGRSFFACKTRWYDHLKEIYVSRKRGSSREWINEDEITLASIMQEFYYEGKSFKEALEFASLKLLRSKDSCNIRLNEHVKIKFPEIVFYNDIPKRWTKEEEAELAKYLKIELSKGLTYKESFLNISKNINRSARACEQKWKIIQKFYPHVEEKYAPKRAWKKMKMIFL